MKSVEIYTDGACSGNPGPGGYAAILRCADFEKEISGGSANTTNNRMELAAPIKALEMLKERCTVTIYSDSAYVVDMFNKGWVDSWERRGWKRSDGELKNVDLIQRLKGLCERHDVTWIKVRGHSDDEYNNRCDRLAVAAVDNFRDKENKAEDTAAAAEDIGDTASASSAASASSDASATSVRDNLYEGSLEERTVSSCTMFSGRVFSVEVLDVVLPDGSSSKREVIRHSGGAAVVAVDDENYVYMVRQYRIAADRVMLEIPAGKLEPNEEPMAAALRELTEETGMTADKASCVKMFEMFATPGYCAEKLHIYFVRVSGKRNPHRDAGEFLHVVRMPFDEALTMVQSGNIHDAKTICGILAASSIL